MRWVMARVFPVPAPARTHSGPLRVLATSRCSASRPPRIRSSREAAPSKFSVVTLLLFRLDYRVLEFLTAEPARPGHLHAVGRCLGVFGDGGKSKHKGGRERPGLRAKVLA